MTREEIRPVVDAWTRGVSKNWARMDWIEYVQIFENRGAMMGASNPHPHGQIWSTGFVPDEPAAETKAQREHLALTGCCLLCEYLAAEQAVAARKGGSYLRMSISRRWFRGGRCGRLRCCCLSKRHVGAMPEFTSDERDGLADALKRLTTRFDNLFETSFPYTMGFHQAPTDEKAHPEWHFHAHFYPPLLRSATVRKFMVGFEMLGMPQRDITPESRGRAAARRQRSAFLATHHLAEGAPSMNRSLIHGWESTNLARATSELLPHRRCRAPAAQHVGSVHPPQCSLRT